MHIPRAGFCGNCGFEMVTARLGVTLETIAAMGPYYKIRADLMECSGGCGTRVYRLAEGALAEHFQPNYAETAADSQVYFSELARAQSGQEAMS
jgi:hypothetical protein